MKRAIFSQSRPLLLRRTYVVSFDDTKNVYSKLSNAELVTSYLALASCRMPVVKTHGATFLAYGGPVAKIGAKYTYFKYFCGGESLDEIEHVVQKNHNRGLQTILDYSVEGEPFTDNAEISVNDTASEKKQDEIANVKFNSIRVSAKMNGKLAASDNAIPCPLGVVKMTGISDCNLLLRVSEILCYMQLFPKSVATQSFLDSQFSIFKDLSDLMKKYALEMHRLPAFELSEDKPPKALNEQQLAKFARVLDRVEKICKECATGHVGLLVDAEQTYLQPAIDLVAMYAALKYNQNTADYDRPIIHNTYQLYLKDAFDRLKFDHEFIVNNSKAKLGAKLVRGAYIASESERCSRMNIPYPFNDSKSDTDAQYHRGVDYVLKKIAENDSMGVVVASHNPQSVIYAAERAVENKLEKRDKRVMFGQLYGMGDSLSLALANSDYNIAKLVPFGPVEEVLPYLSRRVTENSDFLGGSFIETQRLASELKRRVFN